SIAFNHGLGDLKLSLLAWSGKAADAPQVLAIVDGQGDVEQVSLARLPAGVYYLLVEGATAQTTNPNYNLTIAAAPVSTTLGDLAEPNNTAATARDLRTVEGVRVLSGLSIHQSGDEDWFRFELTAPTTSAVSHFVRIEFDQQQGDLDLALFRDGQAAPFAVAATTGAFEQLALRSEANGALPAGVYLARVTGYAGAANPSYTLTISAPEGTITPDRLEPNNSAATAANLNTLNRNVLSGLTIHAGDADFFQLTVPAGRTLNLAHSVGIEFDHARGDLNLALLNAAGTNVLRTPATAQTGNEIISLDGLTAGTYLVRVEGAAGTVQNRYTLYVDAPLQTNQATDDWTILVYITASDLAPFAFEDINEMERAAAVLPGTVNIAVLYDQSANHQRFATGGGTQAAWGTTGRGIIRPDANPNIIATPFDLSIGEKNTGSSAALVEFLTWARTAAPATRYALVMWNHGQGVDGFNFDNADGGAADAMTAAELVAAVQQVAGFRLDVLAFDSCNMAMAELAHRFAGLADVMVGSEENVPGTGYPYDTILTPLVTNPHLVGAEALASALVTAYENRYRGAAEGTDVLSALRTSALAGLTAALQTFTTAVLTGGLTTAQFDVLRDARDAATSFLGHPEHRDLGQFMQFAADAPTLPAGVRNAARAVVNALSNAVVAKTADQRLTSGLSILLPAHGQTISGDYTAQFAAFLAATGWGNFLQQFVGGPTARPTILDPDFAEANEHPRRAHDLKTLTGNSNHVTNLSLHNRVDQDYFRFRTLAAGTSAHNVTATRDAGGGTWRMSLQNQDGVELSAVTGTGTTLTLSLSGRPAGTYLVLINSTDGTIIPRYALQINAPAAPANVAVADWAGNNSSPDKAYSLGVIGNDVIYSGLVLEPGRTDWFTFQTPRNVQAGTTHGYLQVVSTTGKPLTVNLQKGDEAPATGNASVVTLPFDTGTANTYRFSVVGAANDTYQLFFFLNAQAAPFPPVPGPVLDGRILRWYGNDGGNDTVAFAPSRDNRFLEITVTPPGARTGTVNRTIQLGQFDELRIFTGGGNDTVTVNVLPGKTVFVETGAGTDVLNVRGLAGANNDFVLGSLTVNGMPVQFGQDVETLNLVGGSKTDTLTVRSAPTVATVFDGGGGTDTVHGPHGANVWTFTAAG
ncbi:MAG: clostripain-related cysteine peptidase, partial [Gemmataceae bacterium]|nr:clostripain-related cysteine peptidase [Gemmataceae bacterium]